MTRTVCPKPTDRTRARARHRVAALAAILLTGLTTGPARADDVPAPVSVRVAPYDDGDGASRYLYRLDLAATGAAVEVVADRRLLSFSVRPDGSRRRYTCSHPRAPRVPDHARLHTLGGGQPSVYSEWIDLRMYCWGRALAALDAGAEVEVRYGFRSRSRRLWVARVPGSGERPSSRLTGEPFRVAAVPGPAADSGAEPPPVRVSVSPRDARSGAGLTFTATLRATEGTARVYVRDDLFRFRVSGPTGTFECAPPRQVIAPIVDFYRRITARSGASVTVDSQLLCPGAFPLEGVYEVTPVVDLIYPGDAYGIDAVTGTFEGEPVPVRVQTSDGEAYREQALDEQGAPEGGADRV